MVCVNVCYNATKITFGKNDVVYKSEIQRLWSSVNSAGTRTVLTLGRERNKTNLQIIENENGNHLMEIGRQGRLINYYMYFNSTLQQYRMQLQRAILSPTKNLWRLRPRPYQQQCRSNIVECYTFNDSFDNVECCFDIVAVLATMSNEISSFRQRRNKLTMLNLFRRCSFALQLGTHGPCSRPMFRGP